MTAAAAVSIKNTNIRVSNNGVNLQTAGGGTVFLDNVRIEGTNLAVQSVGAGASVFLNNTTILNNTTALFAASGGAIFSFGNNRVAGNSFPGATPTPVGLE